MTALTRLLKGLGRRAFVPLLFLAAMAVLPAYGGAAVPVKFTYQGNLRQNGFLVNGSRAMVFRIYASSTSTTELWTSPSYGVNVSTGVFRVTLEPSISDWESGGLWLELEVEGNKMSPREELTSTPYSVNALLHSGKSYATSATAPTALVLGDLWYDSSSSLLRFWNGSQWMGTSGGLPGAHATTHAAGGSDAIVSLGTHSVSGYITVSSAVSAGWFSGDGSGLSNLNASGVSHGTLSADRIADGSLTKAKLGPSGCASGDILQWGGSQWVCGSGAAAGLETDPLSIHNQETLQTGTTFYVSSGTVVDLNITDSLRVDGTALLKGAPGNIALSVESSGNVGIGLAGALARLEVRGSESQNYSVAIGTGTVPQVVVSTSGAVGIGTAAPRARMEVSGGQAAGEYIMIFNSGARVAAWLRNK